MFSGESFGLEVLGWMATVFIFAIGLLILFLMGVYIADITQTKQAIRRNYPVIGHFRYYFEHIGTISWHLAQPATSDRAVPYYL